MKKTRILILAIIIGVIATTVLGVYATNTFNSKNISYTNENTEANNVSDAVDELYDKSLNEIDTLKSKLNTIYQNGVYLSSVVKVGDYVAYDAGTWPSSSSIPLNGNTGEFGGYASNNKANSVSYCSNSSHISSLKGWRVLSINNETNTVSLVHAGIPECHSGRTNAETVVRDINNRATSEYLNGDYAISAHNMTSEEVSEILDGERRSSNSLINLGTPICNVAPYFLGTVGNSWNIVAAVGSCADLSANGFSSIYGIRPVVVLKPNILTTGKGIDYVGQEAWTLVKP